MPKPTAKISRLPEPDPRGAAATLSDQFKSVSTFLTIPGGMASKAERREQGAAKTGLNLLISFHVPAHFTSRLSGAIWLLLLILNMELGEVERYIFG